VIAQAAEAKAGGRQRFCMGAAWRELKDRDLPKLAAMISGVKALGLETCATLGMLTPARRPSSRPPGWTTTITTWTPARSTTRRRHHPHLPGPARHPGGRPRIGHEHLLRRHRRHGRKPPRPRRACCTPWPPCPAHPDSLPVNALVPVAGTPLGRQGPAEGELDGLEFVRTVAVARLVCPKSMVRLSAGRETMSRELQALCFLAGANSIFVGGRLLTTANPGRDADAALFADLGLSLGRSPPARPRA
jgi:biotin synthase